MDSNHRLSFPGSVRSFTMSRFQLYQLSYSHINLGLGGKNRTFATWPQTTHDTISPHREKLVPQEGIEPPHPAYKTGPLPLRIQGRYLLLKIGGSGWIRTNVQLRANLQSATFGHSVTLPKTWYPVEVTILCLWLIRPLLYL